MESPKKREAAHQVVCTRSDIQTIGDIHQGCSSELVSTGYGKVIGSRWLHGFKYRRLLSRLPHREETGVSIYAIYIQHTQYRFCPFKTSLKNSYRGRVGDRPALMYYSGCRDSAQNGIHEIITHICREIRIDNA